MRLSRTTRIALVAAAVPFGAGASTASAQQPASGTITAIGTASMKPVPTDRTSNDSIAAAVRAARHAVIPRAVGDARVRAALLASSGHLTLGALLSISDSPTSPFYFSPYGQDGTFGSGKYCGKVSRYRTTRTNGIFRRKLIGRSRVCRVPQQVTATEAVTFATSG